MERQQFSPDDFPSNSGGGMRKAGDIFKERKQNYRQSRREGRQSYQDERRKTRQDQRMQMKKARAGGASREQLQAQRKENRMQRQNMRNDYRGRRQNEAKNHRSNMRNDRDLHRHFDGQGQDGFAAVTNYKDNKTGRTVRAPNGSYKPKDSERFTKMEPTQTSGGAGTAQRRSLKGYEGRGTKNYNFKGPNDISVFGQ